MNQAKLTHLVSRLNVRLEKVRRVWAHPDYQMGRLREIRKTVTELVRFERIEKNYVRAEMSRQYAERLISEAVRYGDCHRPTMELATWWLEDKTLVPKLFKVLAVRYKDWPAGLPYTRMLRAPNLIIPEFSESQHHEAYPKAVLELRGNPYPPLPGPVKRPNHGLIHNILLEEARKDYFKTQSKIAQQVDRELPESDEPSRQSLASRTSDSGTAKNAAGTSDKTSTPEIV